MKYEEICSAKFIDRPNRFIARVELNAKEETVHVKNTGRCRELLLPGADVILSHSGNPARKTAYDLIAVYKPGIGLVNIDSQVPNLVVKEWLQTQDLSTQVDEAVQNIPETSVSRFYQPMSWLPHVTLGKTLNKEQMRTAFCVLQESFLPFEGQVTELGLAKVNPHEDVVRILL